MKNRKGLACDMMYTFVTYTSLVPDITNFKTGRGAGVTWEGKDNSQVIKTSACNLPLAGCHGAGNM